MEVSEIHENSERLRKINAYLLEQFKKSKMTIGNYDVVLSSLSVSIYLRVFLFLCSQALFFLLCYRGRYNRRRVSRTHPDVHYYHSRRRCSSSTSSSQTH